MTKIAEKLTFGVEIETTCNPAKTGVRVGGYHCGIQVPYLPTGWKAENDASIRSTLRGHTSCEIVSPILRGSAGLEEVTRVIKILTEKGHRVNSSCGVHVHVGFTKANGTQYGADILARLITLVSFLEKGLYAVTGTKSRERSRWCGSTKSFCGSLIKNAKEFMKHKRNEKYSILNVSPLTSSKKTVEFRVFSGSLEVVKVIGWIMVCLGIVEKALTDKRAMTWNAKDMTQSKTLGKGTIGATEVERLLFILGWGNTKKNHGWISNAIPMKEIKAEFRRLAQKYDGATA